MDGTTTAPQRMAVLDSFADASLTVEQKSQAFLDRANAMLVAEVRKTAMKAKMNERLAGIDAEAEAAGDAAVAAIGVAV